MSLVNVNSLPEDCLSAILCFTSPQDASVSSSVSSFFHSAANSDSVWETFLPSDYPLIVSDSIPPLKFTSKKELFHRLCDSVLIDNGLKQFKLQKSTGHKSYILSARDLSITWSSESMYWAWTSVPESRFSEVAMLRTMSWLEIEGKIRAKMLTPNTKYGAYLLIQITDRSYGLDSMPSVVSVNVNGEREDGWLEVEIGEFFSGESDEEVRMCLKEVKGYHLKGGLVVEGIEVRPKL
ncbi:F-box protein PP2-B15 [Linum perenne]